MAVTLTDHRTIANEADATTNWTGSPTLFTADPDPVEATGSIGYVVSSATVDAFVTIGSVDLTNKLLYVWVLPRGAMDTLANGGVGIHVGDGTDRMSYHVGGSDVAGFRHSDGPARWENFVLDQAALPSAKTTRAGAEGSLTWTAITQVGAVFKTLAKSVGGASNCFVDIIRYADLSLNNGCVLSVTGGTSGDPGTWAQIAAADRATTSQWAHGLVRELAPGLYGVQGPLRFGNSAGTSASWFEDTNVAIAFEDTDIRTTVYGIYITDNGTGTTTFKLGTKVGTGASATGSNGCSLIAPSGVGAWWDSGSDADVTDVFVYATLFSGFTGGLIMRTGQEFIDCTIAGSGAVTAAGATLVQTSVQGSTVAADASALIWNVNTDPDGYLDGMSYSKGTNAHHAINFGTTAPLTMDLRGIDFSGFNASNGQNDSTLYFSDRGSDVTWTINLIGCSGNISYKKARAGDTVNLVINPVTFSIHVQDINTAAAISGARVWVPVTSNVGGKPYNASVTIASSTTTATVTHTGHGLSTNDWVDINGATEPEYNGTFQITVTGTNTYTYVMASDPAGSAATGAPTSTFVVIAGTTNGSGDISATYSWTADQPVSGRVRKAGSAPYYKTAPVTGTIDSDAGLSLTIQMIPDS